MPGDMIRLPLTLNSDHEHPWGFVMIDASLVREIEMFSVQWGIGFTIAVSESDGVRTEQLRAIDIYPHEPVEAKAEEVETDETEEADTDGG